MAEQKRKILMLIDEVCRKINEAKKKTKEENEINELEEIEMTHHQLTMKTNELVKWRATSSHDAHKMHGHVISGDITHPDVKSLYEKYFDDSFLDLSEPKSNEELEDIEVWKAVSDILCNSFRDVRNAIIDIIVDEKLKPLLLSRSGSLEESTEDLYRAFYMFIKQGDEVEKAKKELKLEDKCISKDKFIELDQAAELIMQLDPKYYCIVLNEDELLDQSAGLEMPIKAKEKNVTKTRFEKTCDIESEIFTFLEEKKKELDIILEPFKREQSKDKTKRKSQITHYKKENEEMKDRIKSYEKLLESQPKTYKDVVDNQVKKKALKMWLEHYILKLLEQLKKHLTDILSCTSDKVINGRDDDTERYGIYGLLLSACDLKRKIHDDEESSPLHSVPTLIQKKVCGPICENKEDMQKYVNEAISLTHSMLTLIPPFIITEHPQEYDKRVHCLLKPVVSCGKQPKITYCFPILVFGNQLHVAVKGLVVCQPIEQHEAKLSAKIGQEDKQNMSVCNVGTPANK